VFEGEQHPAIGPSELKLVVFDHVF
jgi:hypothetical protein